MCEELKASPPKSEADLAPLQVLISDAYKAIDKAVNRGILHENTGARRKARVAKHRRELLMAAGLYTPKPEEPGFRKYSMMQAAAAPAPAQTAA